MDFKEIIDKQGYIILKGVFNETRLAQLRDLTDRIIRYGEKHLEDPFDKYYLQHRTDQGVLYDLFQRHPEFQDFAKNGKILEALDQIIGHDIFLYENSLVYKPKGKSNEVPWHQDFMDRPDEPIKYIAWMALDKVTKDNGALKVIPASHKLGFLSWHRVEGETHHTRVDTDHVDKSTAEYLELDPGDVLIFNQLLLHSSDRIDNPRKRRVYRVSYQGFERIFTPRAVPIVLKGGEPESLEKKYPDLAQSTDSISITKKNKPLLLRLVNKLGRKLASM